jgi:hypothetical protein
MANFTTDAEQASYWKSAYERMAARNIALTEALKPFADIGISSGSDCDTVKQTIEVGTVRAARRALGIET